MTYTENNLVEQPAIQLFAELGWETLSASDEVLGTASPSPQPSPARGEGVCLWRETKSKVMLAVRMPEVLNDTQKVNQVRNLLQEMAKENLIVSSGHGMGAIWSLIIALDK